MDISSDGAVSPKLSMSSASSQFVLPPMPTSSDRLLPLHRLPSSAYAAAHPPAPNVVATSHTGAGIFVLGKHGWLAGLDSANRWQDFGGNREESESPWQTAAREFEEETGVSANYLVSLAPPYRMVKNEHIYVIHIMMVLPGAPPLQTNLEILVHKHFVGFSNKFVDEVVAPSIVHRRVLDTEFLVIAAKAHNELLKATSMPTASLSSVAGEAPAVSVPTRSGATARYSTAYRQRPMSLASSAARANSNKDNDNSNVGASSAIQLAVTDAVASAALAVRGNRGDAESCDDVRDNIPQGKQMRTPHIGSFSNE